jgi:hypothetical protein
MVALTGTTAEFSLIAKPRQTAMVGTTAMTAMVSMDRKTAKSVHDGRNLF